MAESSVYIPYRGKFLNGANFCIFQTQIVQKLEPPKIFARDDKTTQFFLVRQLFAYDGAPHVPVNMVGAYHRLDGERSMHAPSVEKFKLAQRVSQGCGLKDIKIRSSKFYSKGKLEIIGKYVPTKISRYTV